MPMVKNENKNFAYTTHRIGGTTYKVKVVFNEGATETMEDKILALLDNKYYTIFLQFHISLEYYNNHIILQLLLLLLRELLPQQQLRL